MHWIIDSHTILQTQANLFVQNESVYLSNVRNMFASENIDSSQQVTTYLALDGELGFSGHTGLIVPYHLPIFRDKYVPRAQC